VAAGSRRRRLDALLEGDARGVLEAVRHLAELGPDWSGVLAEILNVLHRIAIAQALPEAVDNGQGDRERVLALAQALPAEDVQFYYQMGLIGRRDLPLAPDPRNGFEMVLLRMLAFRPAETGDAPKRSLKTLGISQATADSATNPVAGVATKAPVNAPAPTVQSDVKPEPVVSVVAAKPVKIPEPAVAQPKPAAVVDLPWDEPGKPAQSSDSVAAPEPASSDDDEPPASDEGYYESDSADLLQMDELLLDQSSTEAVEESLPDVQPATGLAAEWLVLCPQIGLSGMTGSIAANCTLVAKNGDDWTLHLDPAHSALFNASQQQRLSDGLNQHLGRSIKLQIEVIKPEQETPAQANARKRIERQRQAEEAIKSDPLIRQMIEQFGASIRPDSIEPL